MLAPSDLECPSFAREKDFVSETYFSFVDYVSRTIYTFRISGFMDFYFKFYYKEAVFPLSMIKICSLEFLR
jgi:hypothetical protein